MTILFPVINLAISLLAIFFVIILYVKFSKVQQLEQDYQHLLKEAEDTISSYVLELKEENEKFLIKLAQQSKSSPDKDGRSEESIQVEEQDITQEDTTTLLGNEVEDETVEYSKLNSYEQVFILKDKGYSIDEIAKKLNKGKTEIELMLKFRQ